jgi:hypothetical protein
MAWFAQQYGSNFSAHGGRTIPPPPEKSDGQGFRIRKRERKIFAPSLFLIL